MKQELTVEAFFKPGGLIASVKENFAPRKGQPEASQLILDAKAQNISLLIEAGTGYGKSFAVLVPAIIEAVEHGSRVVISTGTLTLQDQYVAKDLPLLQAACAKEGYLFTFAVAKGRGNMVCRAKLGEPGLPATELTRWAYSQKVGTDSGDMASVPFPYNPMDWSTIGADDDCQRSACPYYVKGRKEPSDCFVYQAAFKYTHADVVVANHTLVLIDLQREAGTLIGPYSMLIIDEAHEFGEKARDTWGTDFKPRTISKSLSLMDRMLGKVGVEYITPDIRGEFKATEQAIFDPFHPILGQSIALKQINPPSIVTTSHEHAQTMIDMMKKMNRDLSALVARPEDDPQTVVIRSCKDRLNKLTSDLMRVYGDGIDENFKHNWLVYLETAYTTKREQYPVLNLKPIDIAPLMRSQLFASVPTTVLMSATMRVNNSFDYVRRNLGVPDTALEFLGESPFDFANKVIGYWPQHLPDPQSNEQRYLEALAKEIVNCIQKAQGRSLVLFTNLKHMNYCCNYARQNLSYNVLCQGESSKAVLIDRFTREIDSVLFGSKTFMTGVDFAGQTCSCVILSKCAFPVPSDPMFRARADMIDENGGSSFMELSLPMMIFDLLQSFGRLIRTTDDEGVFALLDSRARKKSYCNNILRSLPPIQWRENVSKATPTHRSARSRIGELDE